MQGDDLDLRDRFTALRREEEAHAPEFAVVSRRGHDRLRHKSSGMFIAGIACMAGMIAAVLLLWGLRPASTKMQRQRGEPAASITEWVSPTGFLLDTPGREVLRTVPVVGVSEGYPKSTRPKPKHRQAGKQIPQ